MPTDVGLTFVDNETNGWIPIDISGLASTNMDDPPETRILPFQVIGNRFKSSSPDCELFIHDPLSVLLDAQQNGIDAVRAILAEVTEDWRVTTFVVNHEATLSNFHLLALAHVASPGGGPGAAQRMSASDTTIAITLWKLPYPSGDRDGAVVRAAKSMGIRQ